MNPTVTVVELEEYFEDYDILVSRVAKIDVHVAAALATYRLFDSVSHPFPMIQVLTQTQVDAIRAHVDRYKKEGAAIRLSFTGQPHVFLL